MAKSKYLQVLDERFGGVLLHGKHSPDSQACALEVASVARGVPWTDDPNKVNMPDIRPLQDGPWSTDQARTKAVAPLANLLYRKWPKWDAAQRKDYLVRVSTRNIGEVLPIVLRAIGLEAEAKRCENERTSQAAWAAESAELAAEAAAESAARSAAWAAELAAEAAAESAARSAAWAAARSAARSAEVAARSAAWAARSAAWVAESDDVLKLACKIWTEEARRPNVNRAR